MSGLLLQDGTTLELEGGGDLQLENLGVPVQPPVTVITTGDLGASSYPSFFPCPTWEYSQDIIGHLGRTLFASGWVRQRRTWREENTSVELTFVMPTDMFDRWSLWMTNNGYEWFTLYLDRFAGEKVLTEVRLITPVSWRYDKYDTITATATGELGAGVLDYGPKDEPLDGSNDYGDFCTPVYITDQLQDVKADVGEVVVFATDVNEDATADVEFRWFEDNIPIAGETGPSINYTVPKVGPITEEQKITIAVNAANPCGDQWSTAVITVPPDEACLPYTCNALMQDYLANAAPLGFGLWDLMDPNTTSNIPQFFRELTTGPGRLTSDATGEIWDRSVGMGRTTQTAEDANLCDGPYVMRNVETGTNNEFYLSGAPTFSSQLGNVSMAVVITGPDKGNGGSAPENYLFRGTTGYTYYDQTGTDPLAVEHNIRIARNSAQTQDVIFINHGVGSGAQRSLTFPLGYFDGTYPKLVEALLVIDDVSFLATADQSYNRDTYNFNITYTASVWVTDSEDWTTTELSVTHTYTRGVVFSLYNNNPSAGTPMPEEHLPWVNKSAGNSRYYMQGGFKGMYNLAINGSFGGEDNGAKITLGGYGAPRVGSTIHTAFRRNYDDYVPPGYCSLPENTTQARRRT